MPTISSYEHFFIFRIRAQAAVVTVYSADIKVKMVRCSAKPTVKTSFTSPAILLIEGDPVYQVNLANAFETSEAGCSPN